MPPWWIFVAIAPVIIEGVLLRARPQWLTPLAFLSLREHRFTLRSRRRDLHGRAGYRDPAPGDAALPELPARTQLSDSVLLADGARLALRRAYGPRRRQIWLVGLTIERSADEIVLRAKAAFVPLTLPLCLGAFAFGQPRSLDRVWVELAPLVLIGLPVFALILALGHLFTRSSRAAQLDEAIAFVEGELRRRLEEPPLPPGAR